MAKPVEIHVILQAHPYAFLDGLRAMLAGLRPLEEVQLQRWIAPQNPNQWTAGPFAHAKAVIGFIDKHLATRLKQIVPRSCVVIGLIPSDEGAGLPTIDLDDMAIGSMGAEYLIGRYFHHFAYAGFDAPMTRARRDGFVNRLTEAGHTLYDLSSSARSGFPQFMQWQKNDEMLTRWLKRLPLPCALMCCNDQAAMRVVELARRIGIHVPTQLAVLGVDDDEFHCEFGPVRISSVDPNRKAVGVEAARMLQNLIRKGQKPDPKIVRVSPRGVVERQSTDTFSVDDADLLRAIQYMRQNLHRPIGTADVATQAAMSRRGLERRFMDVMHTSPGKVLRSLRLDRARSLLIETDLKLEVIAQKCGYQSRTHLLGSLRQRFDTSPGEIRGRRA
jgi:LacI family transcriptional regulator